MQFGPPNVVYQFLNTWKPAEPLLTDIPCCPPVPEVYTECPDTATVTFMGHSVAIKRNGPVPGTYSYGTPLEQMQWRQAGNISAHAIVSAQAVVDEWVTWTVHPLFSINFGHWTDPPGEVRPTLTITYFLNNSYFGTASYIGSASINASKSMSFEYMGDEQLGGGAYGPYIANPYYTMLARNAGLLPQSIPVTFTGSTPPPPRVRVFMPDAFFPDKAKAISLGDVEEVMTYDPETLTYWGDLKTYAGIEGRLHFTIPNYYPLVSSGNHFIVNSSAAFNRVYVDTEWNAWHTIGGDFADGHLNSFTGNGFNPGSSGNPEFGFYESCYVEHLQPANLNYYERFVSKFRLFVASDNYGGYPTGLPQGATWFDSRVAFNQGPAGPQRQNARMLIAFSKWGTARFNHATGVRYFDSPLVSHYTRSFYAIKSVHPNAHITSLGV